jgi:hypothetical protein
MGLILNYKDLYQKIYRGHILDPLYILKTIKIKNNIEINMNNFWKVYHWIFNEKNKYKQFKDFKKIKLKMKDGSDYFEEGLIIAKLKYKKSIFYLIFDNGCAFGNLHNKPLNRNLNGNYDSINILINTMNEELKFKIPKIQNIDYYSNNHMYLIEE